MRIQNIVSRWPGATRDQTIFRQSHIHDRFQAGDFGKYILVGDSKYTNSFFLATPFTAINHEMNYDVHMRAYQAAVIRTRNIVERQFGVMKRRFPGLAYGLCVHVETAQKLITTAAMLHNICIDRSELQPPVEADVEHILHGQVIVGRAYRRRVAEGNGNRQPQPRVRRDARDEIVRLFRTQV